MGKITPSIEISSIDWNLCYYNPGCTMNLYKPASGDKVLALLNRYFGPVKKHEVCCTFDPGLPAGSTIITNCGGCDKRFGSLYEGIQTITLWEIIDHLPEFPLPDHTGLTVSIQDSCDFRTKPQVHDAVRNILRRMNVEIVESEFTREHSVCCGDSMFHKIPAEKLSEHQKRRAQQMPCSNVMVYCVNCVQNMAAGGVKPYHLLDLILDEPTTVIDPDPERYHQKLKEFREQHCMR